ncbi:hypothetical protein [Mesoplasma seiffertii]|uniref:hypothetical protein n=1 Tax=Mesoplasma seiffertii TaxID=28224 RepID=UPI00047BCC19|nr:hypothetical protein [Mesoplasma seiffertii]
MKVAKVCLYSLISSIYMFGTIFCLGFLGVNYIFDSFSWGSFIMLFILGGCVIGLIGSFAFTTKYLKYLQFLFYILLPLTIPYLIISLNDKTKHFEVTEQQAQKITFVIWLLNLITNWTLISIMAFFMFFLSIASHYYEIRVYFWFWIVNQEAAKALIWILHCCYIVGTAMSCIALVKAVKKSKISRCLNIINAFIPQPLSAFLLFYNLVLKTNKIQKSTNNSTETVK